MQPASPTPAAAPCTLLVGSAPHTPSCSSRGFGGKTPKEILSGGTHTLITVCHGCCLLLILLAMSSLGFFHHWQH